MMQSPGQADLLVVDASVARHDGYRRMLSDLARTIEVVVPRGDIRDLIVARRFAAVLVHLDGVEDPADGDLAALVEALDPATPVIFISEDVSAFPASAIPAVAAGALPRLFDHVRSAAVMPELLRAKVRLSLELAQARDDRQRALDEAATFRRERDGLAARVGEHIHRGNNLLAIMQSITLRTMSDGRDLDTSRTALVGRLRALGRAFKLVTQSSLSSAEMSDVVDAGLQDAASRVSAAGPSIRLSGSLAQTLTLVVHELAANAQAYGAFLSPEGSVDLGWAIIEGDSQRYLELDWREHGGPPPAAPQRYGFGLSLVSSLAGPDAPAPNMSFEAPGFACRLRLQHDMAAGA